MLKSREKYLVKNTAIFAIGNLGTRLINFFMVPLYTYTLATSEYGTINSVTSICSILIPLVMCNIGEAIRRYLLDKDSDDYGVQAVEYMWLLFGTIVSAMMFGVFRFVPILNPYASRMSLYILGNAFVSTNLDYLRGKEKLGIYTACSLFQTFLVALLNVVFLVRFRLGIFGYFDSYIIAYFVCGIIAFLAGKQYKDVRNVHFDKKLFIEMSKFSIMLVPNSIMWWITNASDKLMVTYFIDAAATGIYSVSAKLPTILSTMNTILLQAWQYSAIKENDSEDKIEYNNKMFGLYTATTALAGSFLLLINRPFMSIYVASEYRDAWLYSPFLILSSMFATLNTFVGTSYYVEKDMKGNLKSASVGAVVNVCLNIVLIPIVGVTGAAAATCLSYVAVLVYRILDTQKYLPLSTINRTNIKLLVIILYMLICSYITGVVGYILLSIGLLAVIFTTRGYYIGLVSKIIRGFNERKGTIR